MRSTIARDIWYEACAIAAEKLVADIPEYYRSRTFSGIIGDIKALPARKALSLCTRKKGLGLQYAYQYLATGIDGGRGYQACASTALAEMLKTPVIPEERNDQSVIPAQGNQAVIPAEAGIHFVRPELVEEHIPAKERIHSVRPELVEGSISAEGDTRSVIPAEAGIHETAQGALSALERLRQGTVLDVGCAIGVTAGILELQNVVGFDLFIDLVRAAREVDGVAGKRNRYVVADMLNDWPFGRVFDAAVCGLVCHHLKTQAEVAGFFRNANRVLKEGGLLAITLPSGSIATAGTFESVLKGLESFGFGIVSEKTGLVASADHPHSLFWMFQIVAEKRAQPSMEVFVAPSFSFKEIRTPVTRVEKAGRARLTAVQPRRVIHERFVMMTAEELSQRAGERPLTFEEVAVLTGPPCKP